MRKVNYIIKRFKEKYPEIEQPDLDMLEENIQKYFKKVAFIIFEDYNICDGLFFRCYNKGKVNNYKELIEDYFSDIKYFSDVQTNIYELDELGCIYDVEKDKFFKVTYSVKEKIKEV